MAKKTDKKSKNVDIAETVGAEKSAQHLKMVAEAAYYRAEKRNFENGDPVADWIEAEQVISEQIEG